MTNNYKTYVLINTSMHNACEITGSVNDPDQLTAFCT